MQISPVIKTEHQLARPWREDWIIHSDSDTLELPLSSSYELVLLPRPELSTAPGLQQAFIKWKPELAFISCLNDDWVVVTVEFIFVITFCRRSLIITPEQDHLTPFTFTVCSMPSPRHEIFATALALNMLAYWHPQCGSIAWAPWALCTWLIYCFFLVFSHRYFPNGSHPVGQFPIPRGHTSLLPLLFLMVFYISSHWTVPSLLARVMFIASSSTQG